MLITRPSAGATTFVVNRHACLGVPMRVVRLVVALAVALATFSIAGRTASAAPPSNDTIAGATSATLGTFFESVDTREATTDADDAQLTENCVVSDFGGSPTRPS